MATGRRAEAAHACLLLFCLRGARGACLPLAAVAGGAGAPPGGGADRFDVVVARLCAPLAAGGGGCCSWPVNDADDAALVTVVRDVMVAWMRRRTAAQLRAVSVASLGRCLQRALAARCAGRSVSSHALLAFLASLRVVVVQEDGEVRGRGSDDAWSWWWW